MPTCDWRGRGRGRREGLRSGMVDLLAHDDGSGCGCGRSHEAQRKDGQTDRGEKVGVK